MKREKDNGYVQNPDHVRRLRAYRKSLGAFVDRPFGPSADVATLDHLRSLGHVVGGDDQ